MNKTLKIVLTVLILVILGYFAYNKYAMPKEEEKEVIKIGIVIPLTGELSSYGKNVINGIELAKSSIEENDNNTRIEFFIEDTEAKNIKAISSLKKLISIEKVNYFIGDISSTTTMAMIPIINKNQVFLFSPGAATPKLTNISEYFARNWPSNNEEANSAAEYMYNKLNKDEAAIVYVNNDWGIGLQENFEKKFIQFGGKITSKEVYNFENKIFKNIILKLISNKTKNVYLAGNQKEMGYFMRQCSELGVKFNVISNTTFIEEDCLKIAGESANGVIVPTPSYNPEKSNISTVSNFNEKFQKTYGKIPSLVDANGYDNVYLIYNAIKTVGDNPKLVSKYIRNLSDYNGAAGKVNFVNGDVSYENDFVIVKNGKVELLN